MCFASIIALRGTYIILQQQIIMYQRFLKRQKAMTKNWKNLTLKIAIKTTFYIRENLITGTLKNIPLRLLQLNCNKFSKPTNY